MNMIAVRKSTETEVRQKALAAEVEMMKQPQITLRVVHHYSPGICARELHIPAGTMLTGAIHKFENMNFMMKGVIYLVTPDGIKRIEAPATVVSPAGTKRIAWAETDCIWTTLFPTDERDSEKMVDQFTTNSETDYLAFVEQIRIEGK